MNSFKQITLLLAFAFILLNGCEYEPTEVYDRKVNTDVTRPDVQPVDLNLPGDTVFLYSDRSLYFRFKSNNQAITNVKFQIDSLPEFNSSSDDGYFHFQYSSLEEGKHTLKMEVITHSGTGSIADSMRVEGFSFKREWVLIVVRGVTYVLSMTNENGLLKLSWPAYKGADLKEYIVYKQIDWYLSKHAEVKRVTSNAFVDSSYVGEEANYYVEAVNDLGRRIYWGKISLKESLPRPRILSDMQNNYSFGWNKNPYYGAIDTTVLEIYGYGVYVPLKTTTNASDTSIAVNNFSFGDKVQIRLRTVPKKYNLCYSFADRYFSKVTEGTMGFNFAGFSDHSYIPLKINADEFIFRVGYNGYGAENDTFYRFSFNTKKITEKYARLGAACQSMKKGLPVMSPGGKYLAFETDCDKRVVMINSNNLNDEKSAYFGYHQSMAGFYSIPVTETGWVYINKTYDAGFVVWDMIGNKKVVEYTDGYVMSVSLTGEYMLYSYRGLHLLHFKDGAFNILRTFGEEDWGNDFAFSPTDPQVVYYWGGSAFTARNCADFSIINQFSITGQILKDIDFANKQILTYGDGYLYVRDMETGSLISKIPVDPEYEYYSWYLMHNTTISSYGAMYFFNE